MAFSLIAKFGLDATGLKTELQSLERKVEDFAGKWAKIGLAAGAAAFTALAKGALDLSAALRDNSTALGINVEKLQALIYSAEQNGSSQEQLLKALEKTKIGFQKAAEGGETQLHAMEKLRLSSERMAALPLEKKFEALAIAYAKSNDKAEAYNAVSEILGEKVGPKMIATLQDLAANGLDQVAKSAANAGHMMSAETIVALEKADQAIQDFKKRATIAVGNIVINFQSTEGIKLMGMELLAAVSKFAMKLVDGVIDTALLIKTTFDAAYTWTAAKFQNGMVTALQAVSGLINKILPDKFKIDIGNLESLKVATDEFGLTIAKAISNSPPSKLGEDLGKWWDGAVAKQKQVVDALNNATNGKEAEPLKNVLRDGVKKGAEEGAKDLKDGVAIGGKQAADEMRDVLSEFQRAVNATISGVVQGIRTGEQFAGASDEALRALIQKNTAERDRQRQQQVMSPGGSFVRWTTGMIAASLEQEIRNARQELDMRAGIRSSMASGGESAVYRAFPNIDPLKLDKLIDQFGRNLSESQRTANTIEGIARGLARSKIIPPL